ncbi:metalloregulator ArsR/SmtB family transcription factor [Cellulomonas fengjieae]|uniref:Metalloregulator ArsR/SmtB family transcription factor n=1 Tax=Cellulomonas fengjieae TaxID=2819978 RepID=A0ABS3SKH5_9CELL|nr:metalloregulator ArsR/SmtB family transcription factor [Cellulomonas fengjieae]MBO3086238.1 metalloregulator ArsR/SmtB family transcription factor [Cellulomonas fengjieae]QVI68034.1 metalloregulator ArsR/SmtB family transcription factor [Cellulomonas fengjieae]
MSAPAADHVARALKALADPLRLRALSLIASSPTREACVCDISELTDVSQPTVSHHLKVLKDVGLVTAERRGTWVYYRISPEYSGAVRSLLESFAPATVPLGAVPTEGIADLDHMLDRLAADLGPRFPEISTKRVRDVVRDSATALARTAGLTTHLVVLTERFARQRLEDLARIDGRSAVPHVLFVCVANAGRSQLAAALLEHYAGESVVVRSAGSAPAATVHPPVQASLDELGADAFPKPLTDDAVRAADVVITMGCGDVCPTYPGIRYEDWAVGDPALASPEGVAAIRADIDTRVRTLLASLHSPGES